MVLSGALFSLSLLGYLRLVWDVLKQVARGKWLRSNEIRCVRVFEPVDGMDAHGLCGSYTSG